MVEMIERVARAICLAELPSDNLWELCVPAAHAAIAAMCVPTPAMIDRFVSRALSVSVHGDGGWSKYAVEQWQTMINAALEEEPDNA